MSENLYIKSNRYSNPVFRDEYERIFEKDTLDLYPSDRTPFKDMPEWSSDDKGRVYYNDELVGGDNDNSI